MAASGTSGNSARKPAAGRSGKAGLQEAGARNGAVARAPEADSDAPVTLPAQGPAPVAAAPSATPAAHGPAAASPKALAHDDTANLLAYIALALAILPALSELAYMVGAPTRMSGFTAFWAPTAALVLPLVAGIMAGVLLHGGRLDARGRSIAIAAIVVSAAVVATWGLILLIALLTAASFVETSPSPCITCSGPSPTCAGGSGGGASCCGGGPSGGSGGGSCCGSGSGSGGCSGSTSSATSSRAPTHVSPPISKPAPAGALAPVAGLASALLLRERDLAHHPDTPAFRADTYQIFGRRLCIGCFTTFPLFFALGAWWTLRPALPWAAGLAVGLALAGAQAVSSAGWARTKGVKVAVKSCLGAGLALAATSLRLAPWPAAARAGALLALAGLAYASTLPRARRMRSG